MEKMVSGRDFWQGKKVFVTGHTGFKGSWLCLLLKYWDAEVFGYAKTPPSESIFRAARVEDTLVSSYFGDLADRASLEDAIKESRPDYLIHMAAQPLVGRSYDDPVETYMTNVMGTVHVLDILRRAPSVSAAVCVTSDKCYENKEWLWSYRENEPLGGFDPYSSSKGACELVVSAFRRSFFGTSGCRLASARAGNVIGGGDWSQGRLLPDLIRGFSSQRTVEIRNPQSVRPWQHVLEATMGYVKLIEKLSDDPERRFCRAWNFGPTSASEQPVSLVASEAARSWGAGVRWEPSPHSSEFHEAGYLKLDSSDASHHLHWRPRWSLQTAVAATVEWHKREVCGADMQAFTYQQIQSYLAEMTM